MCTDVVAMGLDIPEEDWTVWLYPLTNPKKTIPHVDRTARALNGRGHTLLILHTDDLGFLLNQKESKVPLNQFDFFMSKCSAIWFQLGKLT